MAPEQHRGTPADPSSDQYAFCVSLFEALYGTLPFDADVNGLLQAKEAGNVIAVRGGRTAVPSWLHRVVLRGLAPEPARRWRSMADLLTALSHGARRRRRGWIAAGTAVLGLSAASVAAIEGEAKPCNTGSERLAGIWDDARREAVRTAIVGTGLGYATDTWERVSTGLDAYAQAWSRQHHAVCVAGRENNEDPDAVDAKMRCLSDRRRALATVVGALAHVDANVVENASKLVTGLPAIERCADLDYVTATVSPPEDPAVARRIEAVRDEIARIRALEASGRYAEGLTAIRSLRAPDYAPVEVEIDLAYAALSATSGDYDRARERYRSAYFAARQHGLDEAAASSAIGLLGMQIRSARYDEAQQWSEHAEADVRRCADRRLEASLLNQRGLLHEQLGELALSVQAHQRALELRRAELGDEHPLVADSLDNLGVLLTRLGRYAEAARRHEQALRLRRDLLGPLHPHVAKSLSNIAAVHAAQRDFGRALQIQERALDIWREALGPDHPEVAAALSNMGVMLMAQGRFDEALRTYERALEIEPGENADHPFAARVVSNIGNVHKARGEHDLALHSYRRALAIFESTLGGEHPDLARTLAAMGDELLAMDRVDEALRVLQRAAELTKHPDAPPADAALVEYMLARARWAANDRQQAVVLARRARDRLRELGDPASEDLAELQRWLDEHRP